MSGKARLIKKMDAVSARLKELYPVSECALKYGNDPWRLLVMARLSAQCTDKRVNEVSIPLFERFPTAEDMASARIEDIEEIIRPCGLFHTKAESLKLSSEKLVTEYGGTVPSTMEELLSFPGVGRKIANLLLGDVFGLPAVVCDTHCIRICGRLGFYPEGTSSADKCERALREIMNLKEGSDFCHRIVEFGREVCTARGPRCEECIMKDLCDSYAKRGKKSGKRKDKA